MKKKFFALLLIFILQLACAASRQSHLGQMHKAHANFGVEPPLGWVERPFLDADIYFENKEKGASIFVNAQCEKASDSPNNALTAQLLIGLTEIKYLKQEKITVAGREALITEIEAKLDGVKRYLKVMVFRKNRCVFDAVLSMPKDDKEAKADFDGMVRSLWAESEL
jgi:hypothetical protein